MAKLHCARHNERVMVIDMGTDKVSIPVIIHRNGGKRNDICDSHTVTIDGEFFTPENVIDGEWHDVTEKVSA